MTKITAPDRELKYKLTQRGNRWMAWVLRGNAWTPLMSDYSLASSAIGCMEDQLTRDVWKEAKVKIGGTTSD